MARKTGLGRGYEALLSDNTADENSTVEIRLSDIEPNRNQPRKFFNQQAIDDLADNIAQFGLLQPIVIKPLVHGGYQLIAGERRWRACRQAGLKTVPAIIKDISEKEAMEIALIENLQREDLNAIEEAEGYRQLIENYSLTQEQVAKRVGKSRSAVANALRLLELGVYKDLIVEGVISAGHGRALLALENDDLRAEAVEQIRKGASVRQIEEFTKKAKRRKKETGVLKPTFFYEVELALKQQLGRKVKIRFEKSKGSLEIEFYDEQDLSDLMQDLFGQNI